MMLHCWDKDTGSKNWPARMWTSVVTQGVVAGTGNGSMLQQLQGGTHMAVPTTDANAHPCTVEVDSCWPSGSGWGSSSR